VPRRTGKRYDWSSILVWTLQNRSDGLRKIESDDELRENLEYELTPPQSRKPSRNR